MRVLRGILLLLGLIVGVALVGLWFYLESATELALEEGGERMLGVETQVDSVRVRPLAGSIRLRDIRIANPEGFSDDAFLEVADGQVKLLLASLLTEQTEIASIALEGLVLRLEKPGKRANYEELGKSEPADEAGDVESGQSVVVRELTLREVTAHLDEAIHRSGRGTLVIEIPEIVLTDLGADGDEALVADELTEVVTDAILSAIAKRELSHVLGNQVDRLPVEVRGEVLRTMEGEQGKALTDALGRAVGVENAAAAVRSLFGGGKPDPESE